MNTCHMPNKDLSAVSILSHLICTLILEDGYYYDSYFVDEETEA